MKLMMKTLSCLAVLSAGLAAAQGRHVVVISLDGFQGAMLNDANLPFSTLRKLARDGGFAEGMQPVNPTVTWPNHTAIISGVGASQHGVLYNGLVVRNGDGKSLKIEPWVDKKELVLAPTVADAAREAGLTTAEVDWVAIYPTSTVTWAFPEQPKPEDAVVKEMIAAGTISADDIANWRKTNIMFHDDVWTKAAVHIIEKHKPNLLLMHLLTTDSMQHSYGLGSMASNTALILADRNVQRVLDALDRAGIRDSTTVFVVSDHGFRTYRKAIHPNAILKSKGLLKDAGDCDAWTIPEGGTAMVYITRESKRAGTLSAMQEAFRGVPGIARVILPEEFERNGYPKWTAGGRMADLVLAAEPGYAFDGAISGEAVTDMPAGANPGTHGYLNTDREMNALLVASGAGIRPGVRLGVVPNVNVAPTIARLLGLKWAADRGQVLTELLK
jgi:predicted AlkP superfamily pyrophosphatase or phosphodiesterase